MRGALAIACATASLACAAGEPSIAPFSALTAGAAIPAPWRPAVPPRASAPAFALVEDGGTTVLRVRSSAAAGTLAHPLRIDADTRPVLSWRWKVDRVVAKADLATRQGDDFAARVYVFFELPASELTWTERATLAFARLLYGESLPSAGICYVWDNRHAPGTSAWNPYWRRIRTLVLESGETLAGRWVEERRDLHADFVAAFGTREGRPVPAVTGIAAGNDTDQTGESVTAWFGDLRIEVTR